MPDAARSVQRTYLLITLLSTLSTSFIWGINTLFLLDAGLSNAQAFGANAFFTAGMVLFEVPTGVVADTWGRRASYLLGALTLLISTVVYILMWETGAPFWAWAAGSAFIGLGFTFFSGAVEAWLVDALNASGFTDDLESVFARGQAVAGAAMLTGLVAGGVYPNPVPYADFVTATTHKTLRGPRGGVIFCKKEYAAAIDVAVFPGNQGGPCMHTIAAKAVCFKEAMSDSFKKYAADVVKNCRRLAAELKQRGWRLVSGGTDTHLLLLDLSPQDVTGKKAAGLLQSIGITTNKNLIPFDEKSPFLTSGLRLGTPALTTRGMGETEMATIAGLLTDVLQKGDDSAILNRARQMVADLCRKFPLYRFDRPDK